MTDKKTEALKLAQEAIDDRASLTRWKKARDAIREALAEQPAQQEPVAKPYAYEYGRDNGDGTYSVVIEKGDLVQTAPAVYNYVRPRNAHKDWPIKELFDRPQAQRKPLTHEQRFDLLTKFEPHKNKWEAPAILIDMVEAAHGIKGDA